MIGVIVWSSAAKRKAVIWCEDQGPLAYLHGLDNVPGTDVWPATGSMVSLESELRSDLRYAFNVRVLDESQMSGLPGILREVGGTQAADSGLAAAAGTGQAARDGAPRDDARRPALRVVASQETPRSAPDAFREKQPALFAVKTAGTLR